MARMPNAAGTSNSRPPSREIAKIIASAATLRFQRELNEKPLNKSRTCATGAIFDAARGTSPRQYREYCKGEQRRDARKAPCPSRGCGKMRRLRRCAPFPYGQVWAASRVSHPSAFCQQRARVRTYSEVPWFADEKITAAAHRPDQFIMAAWLQGQTQAADMDIHCALFQKHVVAPDLIQQLCA